MITDPVLGLMAGIAMAFIPFGAVGAVVMYPGISRRPLFVALLTWGAVHAVPGICVPWDTFSFVALLTWGAVHAAAWVWSQQFGAITALSLYTEVQAVLGLGAAVIALVWPGR